MPLARVYSPTLIGIFASLSFPEVNLIVPDGRERCGEFGIQSHRFHQSNKKSYKESDSSLVAENPCSTQEIVLLNAQV
jgi:hypothetical protein